MSDSSRMMCFAQIMNTIVVPVAVVVLIDQECSALYLQLWNRCQDAKLRGDFIVTILGFDKGTNYRAIKNADYLCQDGNIKCWARCSRSILETLGPIYAKKLVFSMTLQPSARLLLYSNK